MGDEVEFAIRSGKSVPVGLTILACSEAEVEVGVGPAAEESVEIS